MMLSLPTMDANTLLIFVGMIAGLFVYWKKGGNEATNDTLLAYKNRDELQDKQRTEMVNQLHVLTSEVGRLNGLIEEKDKRIAILEAVDITRNPTFKDFIANSTKITEESRVFMSQFKDLPSIMPQILVTLKSLDEHMAKHA